MKELDFNTENSVKVAKAMGLGLVADHARHMLRIKITGEQPDTLLAGMASASMMLVGILTIETEFRDALKFLSKKGVAIE